VKDRLIAYVTPENVDVVALRTRLVEVEPHFAIPRFIVALDSLPVTNNHKIDRKSLAALPLPEEQALFEPLVTQTEHDLASIWKELLELKIDISATSHFISLGATSLSQIRLTSALSRLRSINIPLITVVDNPVLRKMAAAIDLVVAAKTSVTNDTTVASVPDTLSPSETGMWLAYQLAPVKIPFTVSTLYHIYGAIDVEILERAFNLILHRHAIFRARYDVDDRGTPRRRLVEEAPRVRLMSWEDLNQSLERKVNHVFELSVDELIQVSLASSYEKTSVLLIAHHIITDRELFRSPLSF
jgi:gliotoxin/aspirochlorine biosynthesis peptide synthetase